MRLATETDIDGVFEIYSHESVTPNMGFDPCSRNEFETIYRELTSGADLLVTERDGVVAAVCRVVRRGHRLRHSAHIGSLAIHPGFQGAGVGSKFFGDVLDLLQGEGFSRIDLTVAADNEKAISFFRRFGFVIEGTHENYFSRAGSDSLYSEHTMAWIKAFEDSNRTSAE